MDDVPKEQISCASSSMDRALDYGSRGWGFESLLARVIGSMVDFHALSSRFLFLCAYSVLFLRFLCFSPFLLPTGAVRLRFLFFASASATPDLGYIFPFYLRICEYSTIAPGSYC